MNTHGLRGVERDVTCTFEVPAATSRRSHHYGQKLSQIFAGITCEKPKLYNSKVPVIDDNDAYLVRFPH